MKAPRLTYYGITCTMSELRTLRIAANYPSSELGFGGCFLPCRVFGYKFVSTSGFAKQHSGTLPSLVEKGVLKLDKGVYSFTVVGTQYLLSVARNNKHLRFYKSWRHEERQAKRKGPDPKA